MITTSVPQSSKAGRGFRDFARSYSALLGMLVAFAVIAAIKPNFLHAANIENVLRQSSVLVIMSLGLTVVFIVRGVDMSVAQITDAAAILAAGLLLQGAPSWVAIVVPVIVGTLLGALNGIMMAYLGIPAIIGTLGTMFMIRSGEMIYTNGNNPQILFTIPKAVISGFLFVGQGRIGPVPFLVVLGAVVFIGVYVLMTLTPFGRLAKAVGGNVNAAYLAGVDVRGVFGAGFVVSGLLASISGVAMASRTGMAMPHGAEPYLLDAFAAAYVGTLASPSGRMTIVGSLIGALFVSFLSNGLTLLGFGAPYRFALNGGFILLAMAVGGLRRAKA